MLRRLLFSDSRSSAAARYGFAAVACGLIFLLRLSIEPLLRERSPLVLFTLAVAASAIRGGFGPGVFATFIGAVAALYFFPPAGIAVAPEYVPTAAIQIATYFVVGLLLSWLGSEWRELRWQAVDTARQRNEILQSITDGFEAFDAEGRFIFLNRAAEQLIGKGRDQVIGQPVWDEHPEARRTALEEKFREVLNQRTPRHFEYFSEPTAKWFEFHCHPARNGGFTVYFRDVSDRKASELRLRDTLAERDAALEHVRLLTGLL
ncbi:MAG TPA: PAS domain-containing protein, partial [Bryobacteraceae bacterium]